MSLLAVLPNVNAAVDVPVHRPPHNPPLRPHQTPARRTPSGGQLPTRRRRSDIEATGVDALRLHQIQVAQIGAVGEESPAAADDHGIYEQAQLVDRSGLDQRLHERDAARGHDVHSAPRMCAPVVPPRCRARPTRPTGRTTPMTGPRPRRGSYSRSRRVSAFPSPIIGRVHLVTRSGRTGARVVSFGGRCTKADDCRSTAGRNLTPMARRTVERLIDDIDGSEAQSSVQFGLDGQHWSIDLNAKHEAEMRAKLGPFLEVARRVRERGPAEEPAARVADKGRNAAIRQWALDQGLELPSRGRVAAAVQDAYDAGDVGASTPRWGSSRRRRRSADGGASSPSSRRLSDGTAAGAGGTYPQWTTIGRHR